MTSSQVSIGSNRSLAGLPLFKKALESIVEKNGFKIFWNEWQPNFCASICWAEHNDLPRPRLCLDNAILLDKNYLYIDHKGWRDSSNIIPASPNYSLLATYYNNILNTTFLSNCSPCGPILLLLQGGESHTSFTLAQTKRFLEGFHGEVLVRPHPLAKPNPSLAEDIRNLGWHLSSNFTLEQVIIQSRAVLGTSSGGLVKALGFKIPVGAFGKGVFTGHDVVFDAARGSHWSEWLSGPLDIEKRSSFLTAVLDREYESQRDGTTLENNREVEKWIKSIKDQI